MITRTSASPSQFVHNHIRCYSPLEMVQASSIKQKMYTTVYSLIGVDTVNVTVSDCSIGAYSLANKNDLIMIGLSC